MLNQAYENHSNFMATSTEIWSELQDFTPSVVYHKESEQTANEQNIGENQENTAKSKEKGVIKIRHIRHFYPPSSRITRNYRSSIWVIGKI